jgi:hypothetical protein
LHNEELHDLYPSPYIISGPDQGDEMGGAFGMFGVKRNARKVLVGKSEEKDHAEDPSVDGKIIRWIFRKRDGGALTGSIWLRIGIGDGHL